MNRLIDADGAIEHAIAFWKENDGDSAMQMIIDYLRTVPTVNAEPIRYGHWEDKYGDGDWHCSVCGAIVEKDEQNRHNWNRCYHCGAKMDGE